jgi:hypothetical protein
MAPTMRSVHSSHVSQIGYDPDTSELHVVWDTGKTSVYANVSAETANTVSNAWSVGNALKTMIKGNHDHSYKGS